MLNCLLFLTLLTPIDAEQLTCVDYAPYLVPAPPDILEMPLHATTYWVWNADGQRLPAWQGQCDSDCSVTATMHPLPYLADDYLQKGNLNIAACPLPWLRKTIHIKGRGDWHCLDTYGDINYRSGPIWHQALNAWVFPIDLLAPTGHYLIPAGSWYIKN